MTWLPTGVPHALRLVADLVAFSRRQWLPPEQVADYQRTRLGAIVAHAYATVPLYRERFDAVGLRPEAVRSVADLAVLPVLTRAELEAAPADYKTSHQFRDARLHLSRTSGSSGRPLTLRTDAAARRLKKAQFLRALAAAGYRLGQPLLSLTVGPPGGNPRWLRWSHAGRDADPALHLAALRAARPRYVYGFATPLRRLAALLGDGPRLARPVRAVLSSGETLDRAARAEIEAGFGAPVFDIWGAAEVGTVGFECARHDGLHLAEDVVALELLPLAGTEVGRIVLTSLKAYAVPLIRYEIGDLAAWAPSAPCPCGRTLRRITRLQGRLVDCLRRLDGGLVPPYPVEAAIENLAGVRRFQVIQDRPERVRVRVQGEIDGALAAGVRGALAPLLGPGLKVEVEAAADLEPPPGEKFRLIACRIAPEPAVPA